MICIDHFEKKYVKCGKRYKLRMDLLPIPTVHTDKNTPPSLLVVPKPPRKAPRKRNFHEDEWDNFVTNDKIVDFDSINEGFCLKGFTFMKQPSFVIMYRLVCDTVTRIPTIQESISIDESLHISLSYRGYHNPLPDWFRSVHNCKLTRRSMLENFPAYIRSRGEEMNPILREMNEVQYYKGKGRPPYSSTMIRYAIVLRNTSCQSH